jgi:hypothetical protein
VIAITAPWKRRDQVQGRTGWRLFFATVLCGPLAGVGVMLILGAVNALLSAANGTGGSFPPMFLLSGALFGAGFGWPSMLFFGLPAHAFLYRRKSHRIGGYLLAGVLAGFGASLVVIAGIALLGGIRFTGADLTGGGVVTILLVLGAVFAATLFWFIRRPDRDVMRPDKLAATFD